MSRVNAGFYVRDSIGERDTLLNFFTFFGVSRPDSLIYDSSSNIQKIEFPLPHELETFTGFVLSTGGPGDTILIFHTPRLVLVSYACGFTTNHDISMVSHGTNMIDTVSISDPLVDLEDYENLKIYIKSAAADTAV